ncbi:MAG: clostripain-related cysteine peptidase [Christensenellales bacterium]
MRKSITTFLIFLLICVSIFFIGCDISNDKDENVQQERPSLVMIYLCGNNLESKYGEGTKTVNDLLSANVQEETVFLVATGGASAWHTDIVNSFFTQYIEIRNNDYEVLVTKKLQNMGQEDTLIEFIDFAVDRYVDYSKSLIFWNHGAGSINGVCFDENFNNDSLTLPELKRGLANSQVEEKFEFIGFDACLMANYDTACVIEPYAKYMIASEENEPLGGWDYTTLAENESQDDFYDVLLSSYAEKCKNNNKQTYTLSVIDFDKFGNLKDTVNDFVVGLDEFELARIVRAAGKSTCFGMNSRGVYTDLIDLSEFATAMGNTDVKDAIESCVKSVSGEYRNKATGLSIYFPLNSLNHLKEYIAVCEDSNYKSFLENNFINIEGEKIFIVNGGEDDNGKLKVTVSTQSVANIAKVTYQLFQIITMEEYEIVYGLGEDTDILYDGATSYSVMFEGRWVMFDGNFINCSVEEDNTEYTEYSSPIKVNGTRAEMRFVFDKKTREIRLQGYMTIDGDGKVSGRVSDFSVGDTIVLLYDDRTNYDKNLLDGNTVVYSATTALEIAYLPEGYYQYNMYFYDTHTNRYMSDTAVIYFDGKEAEIVIIADDEVSYE